MIVGMDAVLDDLLGEIVRRLVAEFQPEKVFLFGSRAWGRPREDSDYDLLIVVPQSQQPPYDRVVRAHHCLSGLGISKDILVKTPEEFYPYRAVTASLEAKVMRQGRLLYG
jgi:predicted nucleotidyltransferase